MFSTKTKIIRMLELRAKSCQVLTRLKFTKNMSNSKKMLKILRFGELSPHCRSYYSFVWPTKISPISLTEGYFVPSLRYFRGSLAEIRKIFVDDDNDDENYKDDEGLSMKEVTAFLEKDITPFQITPHPPANGKYTHQYIISSNKNL